jgi:Mn-dependent DtxR family transcriptional regulator
MKRRREGTMKLLESGQMYLETILILTEKSQFVRSIDVCEYMGFSKPSVSRAIGLLKQGGYVSVDEEGYLSLTELGAEVANKMYDRHTLLTKFLVSLGVEEDVASTDACKIEHHISDTSFEAIKRFVDGHRE